VLLYFFWWVCFYGLWGRGLGVCGVFCVGVGVFGFFGLNLGVWVVCVVVCVLVCSSVGRYFFVLCLVLSLVFGVVCVCFLFVGVLVEFW